MARLHIKLGIAENRLCDLKILADDKHKAKENCYHNIPI